MDQPLNGQTNFAAKAKFASVNAHLKTEEISYMDDLESACYTLSYLWLGFLPWEDLTEE
jgi:hypothetical protein